MNREIKFRVWDIELHMWINNIGMGKDNKLANGTEKRFCVMQYTGLKDKNGKDIYEGDFDEDFQVVMWCENSLGWQWATYDFPTKEKVCCHCYSCEGNYNFTDKIENIEIHGNIFENPNP